MKDRGDVACRGVGSGRVFVVGPDEDVDGFESGGVLVTRHASPRLSGLVANASAVVCDLGAVTGHLATIAREYRIPAIMNTGDSTRRLAPGTVVTVDADENVIYDGQVDELLWYQLLKGERYEDKPEFRVLRRMLQHVAPLNLRDPNGADFVAENCQSYHDIIHFAHERALVELERLAGINAGGATARTLDLAVPLDLSIIDIGGGAAPHKTKGVLTAEEITSRPLLLILEGLLAPGVWTTSPAEMDLEGFMASATRAGPLMIGGGTVRRNVAIVAKDYVNLNLRVGYHFNVVDARLGDDLDDSYILFRFVGGVTEVTRRTRRARLLASILTHYDFRSTQEGELVVARLQAVPRPLCEDRLRMIGRLIGFSRQLDIFLRTDEVVDELVKNFVDGDWQGDVGRQAAERGKEGSMSETIEVMVLDDEPTVGERLKEYLEREGMAVETFVDSATAVQRLDSKQFNVVVTDLKMKGPSGLDVLQEVKKRSLPTQVIIITGYRTIEAARGAEFVGAFGFVDKPFRLEDLGKMVKKAAKQSKKKRTLE